MDTRRDLAEQTDQPPMQSPADVAASVARSAAQIAAGELIPLEPVLKQLRGSAERIRREHVGQVSPPEA